jgi:hypothetical protein
MEINQLFEWNDPDFCKSVVSYEGIFLKYVISEFQTEDICKLAVQQYGYALKIC